MNKREIDTRLGLERTTRKNKDKPLERLTRDAIAAEKAGMSYGKYKAMYPHTPDEDEEQETNEDYGDIKKQAPIALRPGQRLGTCAQCGKAFVMGFKQSNKLYCSEDCRIKKNNEVKSARRKRNKPGKPAVCPVCGSDFIADYHSRIYCSTECYTESQRKRNRDRCKQHRKDVKKEATEQYHRVG